MPGIFVEYTFLKAHSIPFKMTVVGTMSVGAFWRGSLLNTLPMCHFTVYQFYSDCEASALSFFL